MKTGLFFGSFNPVHIGHMIIANHMIQYTDLKEIWMVVSPHNPLKSKASLAKDSDRLHLVQLAIDDNPHIKASNIEFSLPVPSYTIDTLIHLQEKYPKREFCLIMGGDNVESLPKWKNYELLLQNYDIYVYERPGYNTTLAEDNPRIKIVKNVPMMDISATFIRNAIRDKKSIQYLVPEKVFDYLDGSQMYK
ncbi:MAG TPA: nicotinate (nicotinamide) nucleotide adenylyltransferase [Saprospiraceae bacterium]|nr:nicotinate-nucleotide adenylyltransferase [Saprospiraceae bacterium]HMT69958.1 nicotinate (nicotinamide) nucleotide adenylyltransferase [Saprospiraceae bacterium]HQV97950.1 nicotinate (nicotinamide) nucleotide adenylyltransferase [Saprospiraceae bacterium]HRG40570.1 nicotinate (nicotinamide) nucleotide adenylyltransferase [Saprospiraceae bacterium]